MAAEKFDGQAQDRFDVGGFLAAVLVNTLEQAHEIQEHAKQDRRKSEELSLYAFRDHLTGLFNRRALEEFYDRLRVEVPSRASVHRRAQEVVASPSTLIVLDIDKFKSVNDTHGHRMGDEILKRTAENMRKRTRPTDIVGRWGGEEFVIILPHTDEQGGVSVAEDIRLLIDNEGDVTASFGVAEISPEELAKYPIEDMVVRADLALYDAKNSGRNQVVRYSQIVPAGEQ